MRSLRAAIRLFTHEEGGRRNSVSLTGTYLPHLRVHAGEVLGVAIRSIPVRTIEPGESCDVLLDLLYDVDYSSLRTGAEFEILEGPVRVVGTGQIR